MRAEVTRRCRGDELGERLECSRVGVLRLGHRQPGPIGVPEVPEATAGAVEGIAQEPQAAGGAGLDRAPAELALMQHVDQQRHEPRRPCNSHDRGPAVIPVRAA